MPRDTKNSRLLRFDYANTFASTNNFHIFAKESMLCTVVFHLFYE